MTFTKAHIVEELFAQNIFANKESAQIIDTLFELNGGSPEGRCYRLPIRCCLAGSGNRHPSAGISKSLYPFA